MFSISNVSFSYGDRVIFDQVSLALSGRDRAAIIGDNGTGKTTFLRLIAGELSPDSGSITCVGISAYVRQDARSDTLSGGEVTQREIERALYQADAPRILILDEPTNNLDAASRAWLIRTVKAFDGLVIFASHDRAFIDEVANVVLEISEHKVQTYYGGYADYSARKEQLLHEHQALYQKTQQQKQHLQHQLKVVNDRMHAASAQKTKSRQGRVDVEWAKGHKGATDARQKRVGSAIRALTSKLDQVTKVRAPVEHKTYRATIPSGGAHKKLLLSLNDVGYSYGRPLFEHINVAVYSGERWQIVGPNGCGKTTLLRIMAGDLQPETGERFAAANLRLGYLSQGVLSLDAHSSGLDNFRSVVDDTSAILRAASSMDLSVEDMQKPVELLSRGQQTKLGILKLLLEENEVIIIDEPTNHLDIRARENIEQALAAYTGALVVVSHDDYFVGQLGITQCVTIGATQH